MPSETNDTQALTSAEVQKSNSGAVDHADDRQWYVALVRQRYELLCRKRVESLGYEAYVASQKEMHYYACRKHREVENILIHKHVFIHVSEAERLSVLQNCPLIYKFLTNKAATPNRFGAHPLVVIPNREMDDLQGMLRYAGSAVNFVHQTFKLGDYVRVCRGAFKGVSGRVLRVPDGRSYVSVCINELGCAMVEVSAADLERISLFEEK